MRLIQLFLNGLEVWKQQWLRRQYIKLQPTEEEIKQAMMNYQPGRRK